MNNNYDNIILSGEKIYGDDFSLGEIKEWYADEAEGYAGIVPESHKDNFDEYNKEVYRYSYRFLKKPVYDDVLVYGGGYGTEIIPILDRIGNVVILEPGEKFRRETISGKKVAYIVPEESGEMRFSDKSFDLITCLGVLHHIPNVTYIINEMYRVLKNGGECIIREPITSMHAFDDNIRKGLTKRERGIPLSPFRKAILDAGFQIQEEHLHGFGPITKLPLQIQFSTPIMVIDDILCSVFKKNYTYNSYSFWKRFRPTVVSFVLKK